MFDYWKVFSVIALSLSYSIPSWAFSWIFDLLTSHDLSCPQSVRLEDDQFKIMPIWKLYLLLVESNKNPLHIKKLFFFSCAGNVVVSWVVDQYLLRLNRILVRPDRQTKMSDRQTRCQTRKIGLVFCQTKFFGLVQTAICPPQISWLNVDFNSRIPFFVIIAKVVIIANEFLKFWL